MEVRDATAGDWPRPIVFNAVVESNARGQGIEGKESVAVGARAVVPGAVCATLGRVSGLSGISR